MDPVHLCISLCPIAVYFACLATINLSGRPLVVSGVRDTLALGLAISGLVVSGPMELFMPRQAAVVFGAYVWLPLLALYSLTIILVSLLRRPRLVVYNVQLDKLRPLVADIVQRIDPNARWAGDCLVLPVVGAQLHVEDHPSMSVVELSAVGMRQDLSGWKRLEKELAAAVKSIRVRPAASGWGQIAVSVFVIAIIIYSLLHGREEVAQAIKQLLRL